MTDHVLAALEPAVLMTWCVIDLLVDGAAGAHDVLARRERRTAAEPDERTAADRYSDLRAGFDGLTHYDGTHDTVRGTEGEL